MDAAQRYLPARDFTVLAGGKLAAELTPRFDRLDTLSAGPRLEIRRKFGLGPLAPVARLHLATDVIAARDEDLRGWSATAGLGLAKRLNDAWRVAIEAEWIRREAHYQIYDRQNRRLALTVDWDITDQWQLSVGASRAWGEQVAYASWNNWSSNAYGGAGPAVANYYRTLLWESSNVFGAGWVGYRIHGRTDGCTISLSPALAPNTALPLRFEWVEVQGGVACYISRFVSLSLVHRF